MVADINLEQAFSIALKGIQKANAISVPVSICIMNSHGEQLFFCRMDDALPISADLAPKKAKTSILLKTSTCKVGNMVKTALFGLESTMQGEIVAFGGGFPILKDNKLIGAIGVSGGTVDEDMAIARYAIEDYK